MATSTWRSKVWRRDNTPSRSNTPPEKGHAPANNGAMARGGQRLFRLLSLDAQNLDAFVNSAICKRQLGDFSGALAHINTAVRLQPDTSFVLNIKGSIEQVIGYTEKAQRCYQRAAELDPENYPARRNSLFNLLNLSH